MMSFDNFCKMAKRAVNIMNTLGARTAGGYLRNREININVALQLLGFKVRNEALFWDAPLPKGVLESELAKLSLVPKG